MRQVRLGWFTLVFSSGGARAVARQLLIMIAGALPGRVAMAVAMRALFALALVAMVIVSAVATVVIVVAVGTRAAFFRRGGALWPLVLRVLLARPRGGREKGRDLRLSGGGVGRGGHGPDADQVAGMLL